MALLASSEHFPASRTSLESWALSSLFLFFNLCKFISRHQHQILAAACELWLQHVGSSFLTRSWTWAPCMGGSESYPLEPQESSSLSVPLSRHSRAFVLPVPCLECSAPGLPVTAPSGLDSDTTSSQKASLSLTACRMHSSHPALTAKSPFICIL